VELRLAFSRDQKEKVYIQHKIQADGPLLKRLFNEEEGYFYLCGPTWPVPDVRDAVAAGIDLERFKLGDVSSVERLKQEGRYVLEVY
jgi:sulfite reductase (NADPH) flavoprotein alpha-component